MSVRKALLLLVAAAAVPAIARSFVTAPPEACFAAGGAFYRMLDAPARADHAVRIERTARTADIRIALAENAASADFVLVDDGEAPCPAGMRVRTIWADVSTESPDLVVGVTTAPDEADYRIFVRSDRLSGEAAAALFAVMRGTTGKHARVQRSIPIPSR